MRRLKNQAGNTLIISVILLVLFSVIGLSIMTLTMNGISKNEVRENNIRAVAYAEKGIDRITRQINLELETELKKGNGLQRNNFIQILNNTLNKYSCSTNGSIKDANKFNVCIKEVSPTYEIYDQTKENETRKLIKFKSIGYSGGVEKVLTSNIEMGAEIAPPTLNYAIGANQDKNKYGGNLELSGGLSIKGDIKVDSNISTYKFIRLPKISPKDGYEQAILNLGGKYNKAKEDLLFSSDSSYKITKFTPEYHNLGISDYVTKFNNENDNYSNRIYSEKVFNFPISGLSEADGNVKPLGRDCTIFQTRCENLEKPSKPFEITGDNTIKKFSTVANLNIHDANLTIKEGLYVGGNLNITGNVTLEGPIYVNGDVDIQGANLKSNSMIYTLKDVNIRYSKLNRKNLPNGKYGTLIILAKEELDIYLNSITETNKINGFFYSENDIKIYGVLSDIHIEGGVSGRNVQLTGAQIFSDPRLQISYDKDIIDIYNNLKRKQHVIYKVEPPIVKDREV